MGELFTLSFYKDIPWVIAAGGSKGELAVWDIEENEAISKHFSPNLTIPNSKDMEKLEEENEGMQQGDDEFENENDEKKAKKHKSKKVKKEKSKKKKSKHE